MDKTSVYKLLRVVTSAYSRHYTKFTNNDFEDLSNAWAFVLEDYTYEQASVGLKLYMQNDNGFPPSPGQVIEWIRKSNVANSNYPTPQEAWEYLIDNYVSCSGDYNRAKENYENMPKVLKLCVGGPDALNDMALMDLNSLNSVEKSHFIKTYTNVLNEHKERVKMRQSTNGIDQKENIRIEG